MSERIDVLIIEDRVEQRKALERAFRMSKKFDFEVVTRESPASCVDLEYELSSRFDVIVADLGFGGTERDEELQFWALFLSRALIKHDGVIVVYSGYPRTDVVVRAIRYGADDFISKTDCPPHELPNRIARILESRRQREAEFNLVMEWLGNELKSLQSNPEYVGRHIALAIESGVVRVVASGRTPLEVLLAYAEARRKNKGSGWPEEPFVHKVSVPE